VVDVIKRAQVTRPAQMPLHRLAVEFDALDPSLVEDRLEDLVAHQRRRLLGRAAQNQRASRPVQFPKQKTDDYPDASNLPRDQKPAEAGKTDTPDTDSSDESQPAQTDESQPAPQQQPPSKPN